MDPGPRRLRRLLRWLHGSPGSPALEMLAAALGVGMATAVVTEVGSMILAPARAGHPEQVATVWSGWSVAAPIATLPVRPRAARCTSTTDGTS